MSSSSAHTFLVTAATGNQGGSTVRELIRNGAKVHALVRVASKNEAKELEKLGVKLFVGDLNNVEARSAGTVDTLVISTSYYAGDHPKYLAEDPNYLTANYYASKLGGEEAVRDSGISHWTILRPSWLFQRTASISRHCPPIEQFERLSRNITR
eukprot:TRINITY_DN13982_c0_g1_i1.p2 TRINITY_DN13982_c0_g1~~TRINITY_DN13982_c0_g1_i1.p2  ORF type:complete len:154 (-),score=41.99 TRINITY_DN13982_c0_g1_i1:379-840(-)